MGRTTCLPTPAHSLSSPPLSLWCQPDPWRHDPLVAPPPHDFRHIASADTRATPPPASAANGTYDMSTNPRSLLVFPSALPLVSAGPPRRHDRPAPRHSPIVPHHIVSAHTRATPPPASAANGTLITPTSSPGRLSFPRALSPVIRAVRGRRHAHRQAQHHSSRLFETERRCCGLSLFFSPKSKGPPRGDRCPRSAGW